MTPSHFVGHRDQLPLWQDYLLLRQLGITAAALGGPSPADPSERFLRQGEDEDLLRQASDPAGFIAARWEAFDRADRLIEGLPLGVAGFALPKLFQQRVLGGRGRLVSAAGLFQAAPLQTFVIRNAPARFVELEEVGITRQAEKPAFVLMAELAAPEGQALRLELLDLAEGTLAPFGETQRRQLLLMEVGTVRFREQEEVEDDPYEHYPYTLGPYDLGRFEELEFSFKDLPSRSPFAGSYFFEADLYGPASAVFQVEKPPEVVSTPDGAEAVLWRVSAIGLSAVPALPIDLEQLRAIL